MALGIAVVIASVKACKYKFVQSQDRRRVLIFTLQPYWTGHPGAAQPAVAVGVLAEVLLVIVFCIVELLGHCYFCGDGSETLLSQHLSTEGHL